MWEWLSFALIISLLSLFPGCLDGPAPEGDLKFTDPLGHEVVLERVPERIVTLSPAITETVFALGAGNRVIATDNVSNYPPEASGLPKVFGYDYLGREELVMLDPDLIIMDKTLDISESAYNSVKSLGLPVYRIFPRDVQEVLDSIIGIGNITGTSVKANEVVEDFRNRVVTINSYLTGVPQVDRPENDHEDDEKWQKCQQTAVVGGAGNASPQVAPDHFHVNILIILCHFCVLTVGGLGGSTWDPEKLVREPTVGARSESRQRVQTSFWRIGYA